MLSSVAVLPSRSYFTSLPPNKKVPNFSISRELLGAGLMEATCYILSLPSCGAWPFWASPLAASAWGWL